MYCGVPHDVLWGCFGRQEEDRNELCIQKRDSKIWQNILQILISTDKSMGGFIFRFNLLGDKAEDNHHLTEMTF